MTAPRLGSPTWNASSTATRVLSSRGRLVRLGYYHNFERALSMTPAGAAYVALADQDDRWRPRSSRVCLAPSVTPTSCTATLASSSATAELLSNTYWSRRRNNHTNLASLLVANTVTGAASLFRRELLELVLPFPPRHGSPYHDHWLALVALASGRIGYVDRPLYDYVQHQDAAIGDARANAAGPRPPRGMGRVRRLVREPRSTWAAWQGIYFREVCHRLQFATVLERRCWRPDERQEAARRPSARRQRTLATGDGLALASAREEAGRPQRDAWGRGRAAPRHRAGATRSG